MVITTVEINGVISKNVINVINQNIINISILCSTLSVMLYFTIDFICQYNMKYYPFDKQICNGTLEPKSNSIHFVNLVPKSVIYTGTSDLMKYVIHTNATFLPKEKVSSI